MKTAGPLLRGILAATVGLSLAVPVTAAPAQAASPADYQRYVTVFINAMQAGEDRRLTAQEINALVAEIIDIVMGTKSDVVARLDAEINHEIQAVTEASLTKVQMLRVPWLADEAINGMHDAAYRAKNHLATVAGNDAALDAVGRAMIALFNELNAAYFVVDYNEGTQLARTQLPYFRQGLEYLVQELQPHCTPHYDPRTGNRAYDCEFNGQTVYAEYFPLSNSYTINGGPPIAGMFTNEYIEELAMKDTILRVAEFTLAELVRRGVQLP